MRNAVLVAMLALIACGGDQDAVDDQALAGSGGTAEAEVSTTGENTAPRPLEGTWLMHVADTPCDVYLTLGGGHYGMDLVCELDGWDYGGVDLSGFGIGTRDGYGIEAEGGSYALGRGSITLVPEYSSCAWNKPRSKTHAYELLSGGVLRVATAEAVLVMDKMSDAVPGTSSTATSFGCWYGPFFSPGKLTQL